MAEKGTKKTIFQTEVDKVLRTLRNEIYSGLRLPRERLVENALAESFSVSRMVIRQVLSQLDAEGLVQIEPYKGASVAAISIDRIYESYQVLAMLQGFAAKLATARLTEKEVNKLKRLVEKQRNLDVNDVKEWQTLNQSFHRAINLKCGNERLIQLLRQHVQFTTYWFLVLSVPGRIPKNIEEHAAVVGAFSEREEDKARQLMERHIMGAGEYLVEHLPKTVPIGMLHKK
jgi:DNA-binding GntR family transcriptional regulator